DAPLLLGGDLEHFTLQAPLFGDVASDCGGANDVSLGIHHRRNAERHFDWLATFADARRFEPLNTRALADALEVATHFVVPLRRAEHCHRLADCLFSRVAIQSLSAGVPAHDDALERLAKDGLARAFNDGSQAADRVFSSLTMRHITAKENDG